MLECLVTPWIICFFEKSKALKQYIQCCYAVRFTFFSCSIDVGTGYFQTQVDSAEGSLLGLDVHILKLLIFWETK